VLPEIRKAATCPDSGSRLQRHKLRDTTSSKSGPAQDTDWFAQDMDWVAQDTDWFAQDMD